jgi:hypothetical protein
VQTDVGIMMRSRIEWIRLEESVKGLIVLIYCDSLDRTAIFYDDTGKPVPW